MAKIVDYNGNMHEYSYDIFNRLKNKIQTVDNIPYTTQYEYDNMGNMTKENRPQGLELKYDYDNNGILKKVYNNNTNFFVGNSMNGLGQFKQYSLGNGAVTNNTFYYGLLTKTETASIQDLTMDIDYTSGNLLKRTDAIVGVDETFTYDNLNRLTSSVVNNQNTIHYNYDILPNSSKGNIVLTDYVNANYGYNLPKSHAVGIIDNPNSTTLPPDNMSTDAQSITYTPFQKINSISENVYSQTFTYNADYERLKSTLSENGNNIETKLYLDDCEIVNINGINKTIYYVTGGDGLCAMVVNENGQNNEYFIYKDHLGSIVKVTDAQANTVAEQNFDAWGRKRNPADWTYNSIPPTPDWLYRGFTMHEDMPQFSLINMNGRLYDPIIGRMLSADNYVQSIYNTQNYNRYSYCLNNPLKYTDPSGNVIYEWITGFIQAGGSISNRMQEGDRRVNNFYKLFGGLFAYDNSYSGKGDFFRDVWQVVSRFTKEGPQTTLGLQYSGMENLRGRTDRVDYYYGATVSTRYTPNNGSVTLGSYIRLNANPNSSPESNLGIGGGSYEIMHEYGHYLQSRRNGITYLFKYGWQSAQGAHWTEKDANLRASNYFHNIDNSFTWNQNYDLSDPSRQYYDFPENRSSTNSKWWEYILILPSLINNH